MDSADRLTELTAVARQLTGAVMRRAALDEAVGVLQCWSGCEASQARSDLFERHGAGGQGTEAARVIAVVNAAAESRADPDWG